MPKQIHNIQQFHGGLSSNSDPRDVADTELAAATDVMVDEVGKIRMMGGTAAHDADSNPVVTIEPGYGLFQFSHDRKGGHVNVSDLSGDHTAGDHATTLTDSVSDWPVDSLINATVNNTSDGSSGNISDNTATTVVTSLSGGADNSWDTTGTDDYTITDFPETGEDYLVLANTAVFTDATCDYNNDPTIAHDDDSGAIKAGMAVSGTGIPAGAYVATVSSVTAFELSAATTGGSVTNGTLTFGGGLQMFAQKNDKWSSGAIINLGATTGMKPTFYNVDGALRISDGNFGTGNNNKWYGYIDREFFKTCDGDTVKVNRWVVNSQKVDKPSVSSVFDATFTTGSTSYDQDHALTERTTGVNFFDTEDTLYDAGTTNVSKVVVVVNATSEAFPEDNDLRYNLKVGQSADGTVDATTFSTAANETKNQDSYATVGSGGYSKIHTFTFSPTDLPQANGATGVGIRVYCDFTGTGGDINLKEIDSVTVYKGTGTSGSHPELAPHVCNFEITFEGSGGTLWDKDWNIGCSFVYDEVQEGLIQELADQDDSNDFDLTAAGVAESPKIKLNLDISGWDERITGVNLYMKEASATTEEQWFKQCSYNLIDGTGRQYPNGVDTDFIFSSSIDEYSCEIGSSLLPSPNLVNSFEIETGMSPDEESIISKYKTAVVVNRLVYIGGLELQKEDGTTEVKGDAMIKSPVNGFDLFPVARMIEASVRDGDDIVKLEEYADRILQFKKLKMHIINVSQEIEFLEDTFVHKGVSHPAAVCKTDFGIAWVNKLGCYLYDGQKVHNLLEKGGRQIIKESDWTTFTTDNSIIGYLPKKRQLIVLKDCTATSVGDIYLYDMVTQSWVEGDSAFTDSVIKTNLVTDWNGDLVHAHTTGTVLKWDDSSATSDAFGIITKDFDLGQPGQRKKLHKVYVTYKGATDTNVDVYYDVDGGAALNKTFANGTNFTGNQLDASSAWAVAELKPTTSSQANNIKSFRLKFLPQSGQTVPADFEINDISAVYRMKHIK